jgi:uncharacterized membrane protein
MTASKSSRARQARAQAQRRETIAQNGTAAKTGTAVKASTVAKPGNGARVGNGARAGTVVQATTPARGVATRGGGMDRRGPRPPAGEASAQLEAPSTTAVPVWFQLVTWVLSLAGLGVSIYLTIAHFTESKLLGCAENGLVNCTKVTTSPQSYVFGIPVAVLGLAFFLAAVGLMSPWAWRWGRREVGLIRLASVVVGMGFVLYLLYAELFIIGSICLYCTSVHAITFLLFVLTAFAAAAWGLPGRQRA